MLEKIVLHWFCLILVTVSSCKGISSQLQNFVGMHIFREMFGIIKILRNKFCNAFNLY